MPVDNLIRVSKSLRTLDQAKADRQALKTMRLGLYGRSLIDCVAKYMDLTVTVTEAGPQRAAVQRVIDKIEGR